MTNYEKIKAMSVEELAAVLLKVKDCSKNENCVGCPLKTCAKCYVYNDVKAWLSKEAE